MENSKMPHSGHEQHLCYLHNIGFLSDKFGDYVKLVKNPRFICTACGRAAQNESNLCAPRKL